MSETFTDMDDGLPKGYKHEQSFSDRHITVASLLWTICLSFVQYSVDAFISYLKIEKH